MRSVVVVAAAIIALFSGAASALTAVGYTASVPIAGGRARFHWRVDGVAGSRDERGYFALEVPTASGWVGFGIGEINSGSMPGSDIAIATVDANGALSVGDYHALDFAMPLPDCNPAVSDWTPIAAQRNATHTLVEISRKLIATSLDEDRSIARRPNNSPSKFLVAWGTDAALAYHGRTDRALFAVDIFGAPTDRLAPLRADPNIEVLEWRSRDLAVPAAETLYAYTPCVRGQRNSGRQIVAFNVLVSPEASRPYLHHMVVKGYNNANCEGFAVDLYAVASSHAPFILPEDIGLGMDFDSYNVEIHYDNPNLVSGLIDNSGVEVFTTRAGTPPRVHNAGVLVAADPIVQTPYLIEPGYTALDYNCPSECTLRWERNITVFGELLHMHQTGDLMRTNFVGPDGQTVLATREAEWYAFHTQENQLFDRFDLPRGSAINTRCVYRVPDMGGTVRFGLGSSQEMCMHFIYYYPRLAARTGEMCGVNFCGHIRSKETQQVRHMRHGFNGSCGVIGSLTPTPAPLASIASLAERTGQTQGDVSGANSITAAIALIVAVAISMAL